MTFSANVAEDAGAREELIPKSGRLAGDELRFLRKHAGIRAARFAELLGVDPAHCRV